MPASYLRPQLNQRYRISLKNLDPVLSPGQFGKQHKWTLNDGRVLYTPLIVQPQLSSLKVSAGQEFEISKQQTPEGVQWKVYPVESPQAVAKMLDNAEALDAAVLPDPPRKEVPRKPPTRLESALKTAVHACAAAEQEGAQIGYSVRFQPQDIRAMAISLLINSERRTA